MQEQIQAADARRGIAKPALSAEDIATERKRDGLMLQRTRILRNLETCSSDRYRKTLSDGLNYLESEIAALTRAKAASADPA
ncbi:MAG: hypothetical protein ACRD5L_07180 [Bryobacteraceae bacterium]